MRLNSNQLLAITQTTRVIVGDGARVSLFGSRLDDTRVGGDVDLLIESNPPIGLLLRAKVKLILEQKLNLPVDVIAADFGDSNNSFVLIAKASACCLNDLIPG
jgi:predicted nucleotidyltransferase